MLIIADLHIHSRFSRATSRSLDFIALHRSAVLKGITLVGTGDFTHPGWMAEIHEQLEPAEQGLFRLKPEYRRAAERDLPDSCSGDVRFILQVEISNIYKKDDRTRKNHNLVFVPSIDAACRVTQKLEAIGNVKSDGRPILGLDARDLLEITLESDPLSFLVPAHIWTPWFSMLGSKSGFDTLEQCFGDLSTHIFAAETGLSSDPAMNWRLSKLDKLTLISNSDAHSPGKLGREANLFDIELGYEPLLNALKTREGFRGTLEFYPDEGKYHLDGHRKCNLRLEPHQTHEYGGRCPVCGGKLTVGVMSRVNDLADRPVGFVPEGAPSFESIVPLEEVISEVLGVGPSSKKVQTMLETVVAKLGPELDILRQIPLEEIETVGGPPLKEAVRRVRTGELTVAGGYDGEFGTVKIFDQDERDHFKGQMNFLGQPKKKKKEKNKPSPQVIKTAPQSLNEILPLFKEPSAEVKMPSAEVKEPSAEVKEPANTDPLQGLDEDQLEAAKTITGPLLVVAGPGTGKTRTLVSRIANQIISNQVKPIQVLAISFTNQAAAELKERIEKAIPQSSSLPPKVTTFHGFGLELLRELDNKKDLLLVDDDARFEFVQSACKDGATKNEIKKTISAISLAKQSPDPQKTIGGDGDLLEIFNKYENNLSRANALDVDDLVLRAYKMLAEDKTKAAMICSRYKSVCVDEYQDVNDVQAALIKLLCPDGKSLMVIGDPDQAIYGFRGAIPGHFARFAKEFENTKTVQLTTTYRLTDQVLNVAKSVLKSSPTLDARKTGSPVEIVQCPTAASEAEQIVVRLEKIIGGTSSFALDSGRAGDAEQAAVGFGDVAILCRTKKQRVEIKEAIQRSGIPFMEVGEDDPHDPRAQKTAIMTMHAAKGREYEVVFIAGVEPSLMPLELEGLTSNEEEERRLLYVAITRAKCLAVLSHASHRTLFGQKLPGGPSPFLNNLPERMIIKTSPKIPRKKPDNQLKLF